MDDLKLYRRNDRKIESLVHTVQNCRSSVKTSECNLKFKKCATIKPQRVKVKYTEGIVLLNAQVIREVKEDGYKYFGVSLMRYTAGIINWRKDEHGSNGQADQENDDNIQQLTPES